MPYDMELREAGDEISSTYEGRHVEVLELLITHPDHSPSLLVEKGDPIVMGDLVGVAFTSAIANTDIIAVDTEGIWALYVIADDDNGSCLVNRGDRIFINSTTAELSKIQNANTQKLFGIALSPLGSGVDGLVAVKVHQDPSAVGKVNLKDEVTYSQYICFGPSQLDDITVMAGDLESDCDVVHVSYWTSQALGTSLGIDLVDGGADGSGSAVIDSCADNLAGLDENELTTPYAMLAGEVLKLTVDDVTNSTWIYVKVTLKVILNEET